LKRKKRGIEKLRGFQPIRHLKKREGVEGGALGYKKKSRMPSCLRLLRGKKEGN